MKTSTHLLFICMTAFSLTAYSITGNDYSSSIKKHNREIVFSHKAIEPGDEGALINEYHSGDPLYFRFYMDSTVKQFITRWGYGKGPDRFKYFQIRLFLDDQFHDYIVYQIPQFNEEMATLNTFGADLVSPPGTTEKGSHINTAFNHHVNLHKGGKLRIEIYMCDGGGTYYQKYASATLKCLPPQEDTRSNVEKAGITNDFHLKHVKQIVFSAKPIPYVVDEGDLIKEYVVGGPLYFRLFLDNSFDKIFKEWTDQIVFKYTVDGIPIADHGDTYFGLKVDVQSKERKKETSATGQMMTDKADEMKNVSGSLDWILRDKSAQLKGTHQVKVEAYMKETSVMGLLGEGSFTLTFNPSAISKNHPALGSEDETAVMSDPALEAKFISLYNDEFKGAAVAKKAYLKFRDWDVERDEVTRAPVRMDRVAVLYVTTNVGCEYVMIAFSKEHLGGGKYGPIHYGGPAGQFRSVICR
jgi:hypothetical protein